ncbi:MULTISPECIES: tyrosine-type recombinase/integrase [Halorussus]|uniref:tyrosine-type recombinase/integrase n=1 Tax=Halorussus TaxID=1070314 RepID=UPI00209EFD69|nr:site-specific integrase [Halorussus vallis]USZ75695.1 site-specific integrase [Halorussus vallis]USZ75770.1 site-specific integrase [Halorussus vallis]
MGDLDDFHGFQQQLQRELDKLGHHHPDDQPYVKRFVRKLDGRVKDSTLSEYLKNIRMTSERIDQSLVSLTELDFDDHVYDLRHSPEYGRGPDPGLSDHTVRTVQFAVRKFLTTVDVDGADWAEDYDLIVASKNNVQPEDMLLASDINALTSAAEYLRNIAMIEFFADTGARLSLIGSLRVGDVNLDGEQATYTPNPNARGLKGAEIMPYPIIDSKAILRTYLQQTHPRSDRDDVAFFHALPGNYDEEDDGAITPRTIQYMLSKVSREAGVEKPTNPHNFRHSAITRMSREGYSRSEIEHRVHWKIDTDMWEVYEHISGEQHNDSIFAKAGIVETDDANALEQERRPCGNCRELLAPHHGYCPRCGEAASPETRELKGDAVSDLAEGMASIEDMSRREFRAFVLRRLDADPSALGAHEESPSSESSTD